MARSFGAITVGLVYALAWAVCGYVGSLLMSGLLFDQFYGSALGAGVVAASYEWRIRSFEREVLGLSPTKSAET